MRADDLSLTELLSFSDGVIDFQGRRLVLHSINAFARMRKDLIEMLGWEHTRRILTRFGYFWGHADAAAMKRVFHWENLEEWLRAGERLHMLQGVAHAQIKSLTFAPGVPFEMQVVWRESGEAREHLLELGTSKHPVCWMLVGYASGYCSFCLNRDVYFIEEKCLAKGDRLCTATGKDASSWGDALNSHIHYFQAEDIQGKIKSLTQLLRERTRELATQRRKLSALEKRSLPQSVEARSPAYQQVLDLARRVARFDTSVLITGESGVGKEVLARMIHQNSKRSQSVFLPVNCAALPETLLESELFGHKAGAFTGANEDRKGLFEESQGGTLFLDEISEISPLTQVRLLRVLQEREIMRLGESRTRKIDVRIITATNRDLQKDVASGRFREDLFYRLRVVEIQIPPLRERREDIIPLARYFVEKFSKRLRMPGLKMEPTCIDLLQSYSWPGNVRELENTIERAAVMCRDAVIAPEDLPPSVVHPSSGREPSLPSPLETSLRDIERAHIQRVLQSVNGNRSHAAEILGISSTTLWRKLKEVEQDASD